MPTLFDPLQVGDLLLPNRIVMAPLTRRRAVASRVPNDLMAKYYEQRASAGLILSEATSVTPAGVGYADTPGIWSEEQVESWKLVTEAVHRAAGRIFLLAFGKLFIANPDLPRRLAHKTSLNQWNTDTFYSGGQQGYVDYRELETSQPAVAVG